MAAWEVRANVFRRLDLVMTSGQREEGKAPLDLQRMGLPGASSGKPRQRRPVQFGGAGSGPRRFTRVSAQSSVTWAIQEGLTWQESLPPRLSFFLSRRRWANGIAGPAFRLLHSQCS